MAPPPIRIRVGAALDASVTTVFDTVQKKFERTQRNMVRDQKRTAAELNAGAKKLGSALGEETERGVNRARKSLDNLGRGFQQISRVAEREFMRQMRAQQRAAENFATRTSHRATRFLVPNAPLLSGGRRVAADIARGAGIDFSVGGLTQSSINRQKQLVQLVNQAWQPNMKTASGAPAEAAKRADPAEVLKEARTVANETFTSTDDAIAALTNFVSKTGDLKAGREALRDMARLSAATGTNLEDMGDASADVANALGDVPDKGKKVIEVMRVIAGQGKLGAVEIRHLASQMGKLTGGAMQFEGDPVENIKIFGALTQMSKKYGGSANPSVAATSVASMVNTLKTPARAKHFEAEGIELYNKKTGMLKNPIDIILESIQKAGTDPMRFKKMWANVQGARPVEGLANVYRQAGGGEKGMAAVRAELASFMKGAYMDEAQVQKSLADIAETGAAKAQVFQNKLEEIADRTLTKLIPAFEKLAPTLLTLAEKASDVTTWIAENPKQAIGTALALAIARAGIESAVRTGIERLILGPAGEGGGAPGMNTGRAGAIASVAGTVGAALSIASIAAASVTVGEMFIESLFQKSQEDQRKAVEGDIARLNAGNDVNKLLREGDTEGAKAKIQELLKGNQAAQNQLKDDQSSWGRRFMDWMAKDTERSAQSPLGKALGWDEGTDATEALKSRDEAEKMRAASLAQERKDLLGALKGIQGILEGGINVNNLPRKAEGTASGI